MTAPSYSGRFHRASLASKMYRSVIVLSVLPPKQKTLLGPHRSNEWNERHAGAVPSHWMALQVFDFVSSAYILFSANLPFLDS